MAIKIKPALLEQQEAIKYISNTFDNYQEQLGLYHKRMLDIYKEYSTFTEEKSADWKTTFKVNKAHEVVNKILPRIMSKNPKWIVSSKPDMLLEVDKVESEEEKIARYEALNTYNLAIKDYLSTVFDKYNLIEPARLWAKSMIVYGNALAKIKFKYEIWRSQEKEKYEEESMDEEWNPIVVTKDEKIKEYVHSQYPTIDVKSWTEVYYDPRYKLFTESPAVIEITNGVRLAELRKGKEYFNIDKIEELPDYNDFTKDSKWYKERVFAICGIDTSTMKDWVNKNALSMKTYYWLYEYKKWDERLYKMSVVNDIILICMEEITQIPFEMIRCFEDTETMLSWGFVEPIIGMQKEMNFKKNSASEYSNQALNRSYIYNPQSWINPRDLISRPWGIIQTNKTLNEVDAYFREVTHNDINPSYFQEGNDLERQIQAMTFTVDTSNPNNQQALTNTATGARIKMFEGNMVIEEIRKHFEQWLQNLAYKLLQETVENIDENIVIKKMWDSGFWEINKEALKDAIKKYEIKVEIWSSSLDSIEDRRDDAVAKFNMAKEAVAMWVPVDLKALWIDLMNTFEWVDAKTYLQAPQMWDIMQPMWSGWSPLELPEPKPTEAAAITEQVAQWGLTAWI